MMNQSRGFFYTKQFHIIPLPCFNLHYESKARYIQQFI